MGWGTRIVHPASFLQLKKAQLPDAWRRHNLARNQHDFSAGLTIFKEGHIIRK